MYDQFSHVKLVNLILEINLDTNRGKKKAMPPPPEYFRWRCLSFTKIDMKKFFVILNRKAKKKIYSISNISVCATIFSLFLKWTKRIAHISLVILDLNFRRKSRYVHTTLYNTSNVYFYNIDKSLGISFMNSTYLT